MLPSRRQARRARHSPKPMLAAPSRRGPGPQEDLVAVLEEGAASRRSAARPAPCRPAWSPAGCRSPSGVGRRDGAGAEQVARAQVAAVAGVVRHHLRHRPVHVPRAAERQAVRGAGPLPASARVSSSTSSSMAKRALRAGRPRPAGRRSGAGSPSGRGGWAVRKGASASGVTIQGETVVAKFLARNGPERLVLPGLDVARRPVVQQAVAGDVLGRLADRDRAAQRVAGADPDPELELVVQVAAGAEARAPPRPGRLRWPFGRRTGVPEGTTVEARP